MRYSRVFAKQPRQQGDRPLLDFARQLVPVDRIGSRMKQFQLRTSESTRVGLHQHLLQRDADLVAHYREAVPSTSGARRSRHADFQPAAWSNRRSLPTSKAALPKTSYTASVPGHIWPPSALARCEFRTSKPCARTKGARGNELPEIHCYGCCVDELYHEWRTHLSLDKDAPESRRIQPPQEGRVIEIPAVGGLHHHYERRAA